MLETATFNRRILAIGVDLLIIGCMLLPISSIINFLNLKFGFRVINFDTEMMMQDIKLDTFIEMLYQSGFLVQTMVVQMIYLFIIIFYYVILIANFGTTPGKKLLGCIVVDAITGNKPSTKQVVIRAISMLFSVIFFGLGLIMIEFTKKNQALHDKCAKTLVVFAKKS